MGNKWRNNPKIYWKLILLLVKIEFGHEEKESCEGRNRIIVNGEKKMSLNKKRMV